MSDVLKVQPTARLRLTKNTNDTLFDQPFRPADLDFTQFAGQAVTVGTATSRVLDLGSVSPIRHVVLQVDNACSLSLNAGNKFALTASGCFFLANCSLTSIKVKNNSSTNTVTVNYGVCN